MSSELARKYDINVPRYTSYPTAAQFHAGVGADDYAEWLGGAEIERLCLYVHVPFCRSLCWYCACHMRVVNRPRALDAYADLLIAETELVADLQSPVATVALQWGGGTPTHLGPERLERVASAILTRFPLAAGAEHSIEIDPRTFDRAMAESLARLGVTRASFGVQDFEAKVQAAINRDQSYEETKAAVDTLRAAGIEQVNLDLVYGLPGQTRDSLARTLDLALGLQPDRLAVFGYAHVPWMKAHQRLIDESILPGASDRLAMVELINERLARSGMHRVGFDHYARIDDPLARADDAGRLRRNFQGYTDVVADATIGLGASAISDLPHGLAQNAVDIRPYGDAVRSGRLATVRGVAKTAEDRLRAEAIERLLCDFAVDLDDVAAAHGAPVDVFDGALDALDRFLEDGLIDRQDRRIGLTEMGKPWVRVVAAAFDQYLEPDGARHARAV